mgnify:CR=1 FL=1
MGPRLKLLTEAAIDVFNNLQQSFVFPVSELHISGNPQTAIGSATKHIELGKTRSHHPQPTPTTR